jgi:hypothetical protein
MQSNVGSRIEFLTHFRKRPSRAKSVSSCDSLVWCSIWISDVRRVLIEESFPVRMRFIRIDLQLDFFSRTPLRQFRRKHRGGVGADSRDSTLVLAPSHLQSFLRFFR